MIIRLLLQCMPWGDIYILKIPRLENCGTMILLFSLTAGGGQRAKVALIITAWARNGLPVASAALVGWSSARSWRISKLEAV